MLDTQSKQSSRERQETAAKYTDTAVPYNLRHFDICRPEVISHKLAAFRAANAEEFMLVADFDNTLACRGYSIWELLRDTLPEAGRAESDQERRANLSKESAGELTAREIVDWSKHELARYAKYGITTAAIEQAMRGIKLRRGARKLFDFCHEVGMERHILSASIADAIELVTKRKRLRPTQVHSNRLRTKDGIVVEWDGDIMYHNLNKHEHALRVVLGGIAPEDDARYKIVIGDTRHDADMIAGNNVLRIRMRGKHGNTPTYLAESFAASDISPGFDLVLRTESLLPIVGLVQWLARGECV